MTTTHPELAASVSDERIDAHLDNILRAAGSALRHYTMQKSKDDMRTALRTAILRPAQAGVPDAARDVLSERQRQVSAEGWTPEHDDEHGDGSMATAAAAYAIASLENNYSLAAASELFSWTGWAKAWWKPSSPRRDLIKAGALILAEIERLDRAAMLAAAKEGGAA